MRLYRAVLCAGVALVGAPASAEILVFGSERHCLSSGRLSPEVCANASANASAEFEEKAPRFPDRQACEHVFHAGCSLGFRGEAGFGGRRDAIFFTPRQQGFRIIIRSGGDIRVTPVGAVGNFSSRSALTRDASIRPRGARDYRGATAHADGSGAPTSFGVATPDGAKGAVPPRPPFDPDFDCASVLEPGSDPSTGCVAAPLRRR